MPNFAGRRVYQVFSTENVCEPGLVRLGAFWRAETTKNWEKLPGSDSNSFLSKLGAGSAQLGVFGRFGAIEAIYFSF